MMQPQPTSDPITEVTTDQLLFDGRRRFVGRALVLFALGSVAVFLLEVIERQGIISDLIESVARMIVCSILLFLLAHTARRLSNTVVVAVRLCITFVTIELCFEIFEQFDSLRVTPLITKDSDWHHAINRFIVACWTGAGFYLLYVLLYELDESYEDLRQREVALTNSNAQLQETLDALKSSQSQVIQQERLNALGQMASGIAHDLNNALTPVVSISRGLRHQDDVPPKAREALELIYVGANHSAEVVKQLQHFYRPNSAVEHVVVDVNETIRQAVSLTRYRWQDDSQLRGTHIEVQVDLAEDTYVRGNATELIQLLTNLLLNSFDSLDRKLGRVKVSSRILENERLEVVVADDGCGMTREQQMHCFEPFYSSKADGSGLGLSVCHGIVRRHRGTIAVTSSDQGTRCFIRLPLCAPAPTALAQEHDDGSARQKKVLCIDDNETIRRAMHLVLEPTGVELETVADGIDGLARLKEVKFDLLVTDLGMHIMSGREVVDRAKQDHPDLLVAVASGWSREEVLLQFEDGGARPDFIIEKPVSARAICDCLVRDNIARVS